MITETSEREGRIKRGVVLVAAPWVNFLLTGALARPFGYPSPRLIQHIVGVLLLAGFVSGIIGLRDINIGRAGRYDKLGLVALGLLFGGVLFWLISAACSMLLYWVVFHNYRLFGGR